MMELQICRIHSWRTGPPYFKCSACSMSCPADLPGFNFLRMASTSAAQNGTSSRESSFLKEAVISCLTRSFMEDIAGNSSSLVALNFVKCSPQVDRMVWGSEVTCWLINRDNPCWRLFEGGLKRFEDFFLNCWSKCCILFLSSIATQIFIRFLKSARVLVLAS